LVLSTAAFGLALVEIVWINLLLSGDNALVIALACRSLPPRLQKWGMILGTVPAVILRIVFSCGVAYLIGIPYLKIAGGILLLWISYKLLQPDDAAHRRRSGSAASIWAAAWTIIVADAVMSLDNVVAIAAAARGNMVLLVIGLVISMPMVVCGANLLARLLERWPVLVVGGASLLAYIAGDLIVGDPSIAHWFEGGAAPLTVLLPGTGAALLAWLGLAQRAGEREAKPKPVRVSHR
jgi:YjbE family integral membrane protein